MLWSVVLHSKLNVLPCALWSTLLCRSGQLCTGNSQVLAWKTDTNGNVSPFFALTTESGLRISNSGVEAAELGAVASCLF